METTETGSVRGGISIALAYGERSQHEGYFGNIAMGDSYRNSPLSIRNSAALFEHFHRQPCDENGKCKASSKTRNPDVREKKNEKVEGTQLYHSWINITAHMLNAGSQFFV